MKKFIKNFIPFILILGGQWSVVNGQATTAIPYQGVARNAAGNIVANQPISLRFSILEGSAIGTVVYQETHHVSTSSLGLFDVKITNGTATGPFNPIKWNVLGSLGAFLKVEMDINGGSAYVDMGTTQLLSVPFAMYAEKSGSTPGSVVYKGTWNAASNSPDLTGSTGNNGDFYVVTNAGSTSLNGINDWAVGDWAIYNGSAWGKVDNTDAVSDGENLSSSGAQIFKTKLNTVLQFKSMTNSDGSVDMLDNPNSIDITVRFDDAGTSASRAWSSQKISSELSSKEPANPNIQEHITSSNNPHNVTKAQVGLSNVQNLDATDPSNINQDATHRFVSDTEKSTWNGKQDALGYTAVPTTRTVNGHALTADVTVTKSDVGLGNVQNLDATDPSNINQDATHRFVSDTEISSWNGKLNLSGGTMTGDLILNANPSAALGAATKKYVDDEDALKADKVTGAVSNDIAILSATGNLVDGGKKLSDYLDKTNLTSYTPTADFHPATKKYVDDQALAINTKVSKSGDTMTGDLVLNADPSTALGAATKQYVDSKTATKLDLAGGTMTGDLVLHAAPSTDFNPATKKYVDDADALKADKVTGATNGNFAALSADGNLADGGAKTASNIAFVPTTLISATNVQGAITEVNAQFGTLIDSYIHKLDDGVSIYLPPGGTRKRFGIGDTAPECPLGISSEGTEQRVLVIKPGTLSTGPTYTFSLKSSGHSGFSIDDISTGVGNSRLFIQESDGYVGIGTSQPNEKLHIESSTTAGVTGIKILNTASTVNQGWSLGHINDASVVERDGAFGIFENTVGGKVERITILPNARVGINELIPDTKLHVSRSLADPNTPIALIEGTGIMTIGPITNNVVADYRGIQARTGSYIGSTLNLVASELNIQRLGGDILIHGDATMPTIFKGIITTDAKLGLGTITPTEKIDINGAIKIGTSTNNNDGTIRWTGTDFEGRKAGAWVSLTSSSIPPTWSTSVSGAIYFEPAGLHAKVGIGLSTPTNALQVYDNEAVSSSNSAASLIHSEATTSSTAYSDTRIGLEVKTSQTWSSNADARNVGVYVSNVSGQSSKEANVAAVLNGNVVIGDLSSSKVVGSNGTNVLAIQTGSVPSTAAGTTPTAGIQIYSNDLSLGAVSPPASIFHLMNGDGTVIKLFRGDALTAPDNSTISSTTYGTTEEAVINNLRSRINDLEARLQAFGLLN